MVENMSDFSDWLSEKLTAVGWSYNELGRQAGISSGGVSLLMSGQQEPSYEFCRKIAHALNEPLELVLRKADLLPETQKDDPLVKEIMLYIEQLSPEEQEDIAIMIRALAKKPRTARRSVSDKLEPTGSVVTP